MQLLSFHLHPLFFATVCTLLAIIGMTQHAATVVYALIILLISSIYALFKKKSFALTLICCLVAIATSMLHITYKKQQMQHAQSILMQADWRAKGCLESIEIVEHLPLRYCYTIAISELFNDSVQQPFHHRIMIYGNKPTSATVGDTVVVSPIHLPRKNKSESDLFLLKHNCVASLFSPTLEIHTQSSPSISIKRFLFNLRTSIFSSLRRKMPPPVFSLFSSIFLGKVNKKTDQRTNNTFMLWGLSHFLARSGLHLVLFLLMWQCIFSYVPLHLRYKKSLLICILSMYALLSWSSISFIRALISWMMSQALSLLLLPTNSFYIYIATCFVVIITNPFVLFFLDFQLSFALTFALIIFNAKNHIK